MDLKLITMPSDGVHALTRALVGATILLHIECPHAASSTASDTAAKIRSEICARSAARWFYEEYGGERFGAKLQHHYFRAGKICYALVMPRPDCQQLFDINDPKNPREEAINCGRLCTVKETKCNSDAEWRTLIRPYMEE